MFKVFMVCLYFNEFHDKRGGTMEYYDDGVPESEFINYLLNEKHFAESLTDKFIRLIYNLKGVWIMQNEAGRHRLQIQRRVVFDALKDAKDREYLNVKEWHNNHAILCMDYRGRKFIKPLYFIETLAREFGYFASIISALLIGVISTILVC